MTYCFDFRRYCLPLRVAVRTAHGIWREREGVLVRLENAAGAIGYGEAAPIAWFGTETVDEIVAGCAQWREKIDEDELARVPARLACLRNALTSGLEMVASTATIRGAAEDEPRVKDNAPYLAVAALLPAGRAVLKEIEAKSEAGFRVFKWKVGVGEVADELGLLDDVCAALPGGAKLRLDANGAWDRRAAERWLERCSERPVEFLEQPIAAGVRGADDVLLGLARDYPTPIALDESLVSDGDVDRWLGAGWPGVLVIKPSLFGEPKTVLAKLAAAKSDVVFSSALETAIGARAALRQAFAWTGERRALGFGVWPLFADARFDGPHAAPFVRIEDVERIEPEAIWNALR